MGVVEVAVVARFGALWFRGLDQNRALRSRSRRSLDEMCLILEATPKALDSST
jgi:hypothetical protein